MPASHLPLAGSTDRPLMETAARSLDGVRRRVFTTVFGSVGAHVGVYVGKNLARGDASGARGGGLKLEF